MNTWGTKMTPTDRARLYATNVSTKMRKKVVRLHHRRVGIQAFLYRLRDPDGHYSTRQPTPAFATMFHQRSRFGYHIPREERA